MINNISILLPAYNGEKYLSQAIESVLQQTFKNFKVYLINDGSTDNTLKIMKKFAQQDHRVIIITHDNIGMGASLNKALELVDTEWIARMDADDIMEPIRLERQIDFIKQHPEIAVASSFVSYIDANNKVIGKSTSEFTNKEKVDEYLSKNKLIGFSHPAVLFKKDVILEVGGYRPQFWPADDIDLWNRVAERGYGILVQPEYLLRYRIHSESVSIKSAKNARIKVDWLKECMICRRSGREEPTWEEFLIKRQKMPLFQRINKERKDWAKTYYKAATFYFAQKKYIKFFHLFGKSVLLEPSYAIRQAIRKI